MTKPTADLEERLRNNDKKALEEVYLLYKDAFINYASRFELSRDELLDIYQDSVIAIYQSFATKNTILYQSNLKTYLFGVGKHKIYDHLKIKQQIIRLEKPVKDYDTIALEDHDLTMEQQKLKEKFALLGKSCRDVLTLFYYRGLSIKDIVDLTHYENENTVKSQKSRCLKQLIKLIKES